MLIVELVQIISIRLDADQMTSQERERDFFSLPHFANNQSLQARVVPAPQMASSPGLNTSERAAALRRRLEDVEARRVRLSARMTALHSLSPVRRVEIAGSPSCS